MTIGDNSHSRDGGRRSAGVRAAGPGALDAEIVYFAACMTDTLAALRLFVGVARTGNFSRAGREPEAREKQVGPVRPAPQMIEAKEPWHEPCPAAILP
jgi:hypothetical protein